MKQRKNVKPSFESLCKVDEDIKEYIRAFSMKISEKNYMRYKKCWKVKRTDNYKKDLKLITRMKNKS